MKRPRGEPSLLLHEEIMLLALRDEKGTVDFGSQYAYALGGAILAELLQSGRISVEDGKKKLVDLRSCEPLGDPVIDECLERISAAGRRASLQTWVQRFSNLKKLHHRVAEGLCQRGILRVDRDKVLLIFNRTVYPEIDPRPERRMIERMRKAIFNDGPQVVARTGILISLAKGANLLGIPFDKKELARRKSRIEQITHGELLGKATSEAIEAAEAAIVVACIVPMIAS